MFDIPIWDTLFRVRSIKEVVKNKLLVDPEKHVSEKGQGCEMGGAGWGAEAQ